MAKKKRKVQTHKLDMLAPHSGFSSREKMVRAMYDQYQDIVRIRRMEKSRAYINTDYDDHRKKRRVKAVLSTMDMVKSKIAPICPDIPAVFNVERDWAAASGTPLNSYDAEEPSLMTMLGAAMWMLDQIRENGKLSEAIESFPEACNAFDEMEMPITDLQDILSIGRNTAYSMIQSGIIPAVRVGRKKWRISKQAVIRYLDQGQK